MEKKQITLVATDLDGTFLNSEKKVTDLNREAIHRLKEKGILFGIASGRPIDTIRPMIADWQIEKSVSFIVGMNGGVLYDARRREKEEYHLIPGAACLKVYHFFKDLDITFQITVGPTCYTNHSTEKSRARSRIFGEYEIEVDLEEFLKNRDVNKMILHFNADYMPVIKERAAKFRDHRVVGFATADDLFEYVDPAINKGFGIRKLAKHYGTDLSNIVVFGDAPNDREMIEIAGTGVCMKNGSEESKRVADYITPETNDDSAVGRFIMKHIMENAYVNMG
jgi:Cof subfamily protein (haloacid dehalogenase superfamily)